MGAREDKTFLFLTIAVFIVTVGSIVLMVRPIVPTLPSPPNMLTGQAFAAGDPIHSGYAPPWDFASAELFYEVTQPSYTDLTGSDEVTVSITIDREDAFIYKRILYYDEQNTEWDQLGESGWTKDSYDAEITFTLDELSEDNYLLAYTCIYDADKQDKWDCGCKNPTDTVCRAYTIQHFKGPPVITPPSSDTACSVNADCTNSSKSYYDANKKYCRPVLGVCVECKNDAHCDAGKVCTNSVCVAPGTTGCTSDGDCSGSTPKCDVALGECFECLLDDDCASTEYCDEGSCEETTPSTITDMVITKNTVLFKVGGTYDCGAGPSPLSSPAINGFVYDEDTGAIYANDHAGMTRFLVNKLQAPTVTIKDLHGGSVSQCQINNAAQTVSNCIAINGDTAGCVPPRTYAPVMAGEGVVYVETTSSLSHENSHLLYSDTDGSFDLNVEFGTAKRITTPFIVARGNNNGDAIIAGMTGFKGNYLQFFDTGSKRYGLLAVGAGYTTSVTLTNLRLIDLTNTFNPVDLGPLSQHADLYKLIAPLCSASGSCYLSVLERTMRSATPEKHTILKEGSQYVLYDYTNPTAVTELDRFSCSSLFCYEGPVLGLRDTLGAVLEGDTIYVHIPGGAEYRAIVKKDYPELNPLKVNKCHDRATKPCYFGQIWKHKLGTNGWQKAADIPGTLVQIRDGKAWLFGTGYGSHTGPDGIYDPNQLHSIPYSTNTYNANIFPGYRLKVYDLTDGSELLHEELKVPIDVFRPKMTNSPSLAVMEKGGKYYVYILYWAIANSPNHYNYLIGHEVSACSGASCNVGSIPLTTTTGAIVTVGGSGGSGGGGGTGAVCGNAIKETGEACDLGDASHGDGNGVCQKTCSAMCTLNSCGGGGACTCSGQGYECDWQSICGAVSPTMCGVCPTGEECNTAGKCEDAAPTTKTIQKKVESSPGNVITYGGVVCPIEKTCAMWTSGCLSTGVVPGYSNLLCTSDGVTRVCNPAMVTETRGIYTCAYPNGAYGWTTGGGGPGSS